MRATLGLGYRAPSFENASAGYVVEGNPDLRPETSQSLNIGAEYKPAGWIWLSVNFYRNDIENLIFTETIEGPGAGGPRRIGYLNIAEAYTQGIESVARFGIGSGLLFELGYTLTDSRDGQLDRALQGRALHHGTFRIRYRYRPWGVEGMARGSVFGTRPFYLDEDGDGAYETNFADPYSTIDLRFAKSLWDRHRTLFVGAENLLDAGDAGFLPIPPRTFYGGLTARY